MRGRPALGLYYLSKPLGYHGFDGVDDLVKLDLHVDGLISGDYLANALFEVSGAYDDPDGHAEQVSVGEHCAGSDIAVVIDDFHLIAEHFLIEIVRNASAFVVVRPEAANLNVPRSDAHRPNGAVFVVVSLADRSRKPAHADAVAAHNGVMQLALSVGILHTHGLGILGAELEYIADLDTS